MGGLPIFLKSDAQHVLVVGSTAAAMAKIALIAPYGLRLTLVGDGMTAALAGAGLSEIVADANIIDRPFVADDLDGKSIVYASTDVDREEQQISDLAQARNLPVNIVDRPALSTFITPAQFNRGPLQVAYSSGGIAPVFIRRLRALLERLLPPSLGVLAAAVGTIRSDLKQLIPDMTRRRMFWDALFDAAGDYSDLDEDQCRAKVLAAAHKAGQDTTESGAAGIYPVQLVGAGPGNADYLTIAAHRALQQADVILYDHLVSRDVLALARRDAELIYVGKKEGNHGIGQPAINALMVEHAHAKRRVVRLKSGDPLMFARAGEELEALRAAQIDVQIIPGITAMTGIAAQAQLPMTDRQWSSSVTLVTGHCRDGEFEDWARLSGKGQTLAVYMGIKSAPRISAGLISHGVAADTPVGIIENGTRANERRIYGTLAMLGQLVATHEIKSPALLIIGDVVQVAEDWPARIIAPAETA